MPTEKIIRIFVDAHGFDQEYQGSRTFIQGIYGLLAKKKELHLFLGAFDPEPLKEIFGEAGNISFIKYSSRSALYRLGFELPRLIRRHRIDYAHFQYIVPLVKNCRQIVTLHDVIFREDPASFSPAYRLLKSFLYRRSARRADIITTVSAYSRRSILRYLDECPQKITVIPNGVAPCFFEPCTRTAAKACIHARYGIDRFLLCVSRFEPRKNQLLLARDFLSLGLCHQGYHLVLLGHGSARIPGLQALLDSLPPSIRQTIFIRGGVPDEDLVQFYRAADLFIYPSQAEGFGIPPLEAAAAGVPVICSNRTAMSDFSFFRNGHIDPLVPGLMQARISEVLGSERNEDQLQRIAAEVKEKYSWEVPAEQLYQLILNHSIINHDQLSAVGNEKRSLAAQLPACKAFSASRD